LVRVAIARDTDNKACRVRASRRAPHRLRHFLLTWLKKQRVELRQRLPLIWMTRSANPDL